MECSLPRHPVDQYFKSTESVFYFIYSQRSTTVCEFYLLFDWMDGFNNAHDSEFQITNYDNYFLENDKNDEEYQFGVLLVEFLLRNDPAHPVKIAGFCQQIPCPGFNEKIKEAVLAIENHTRCKVDAHFFVIGQEEKLCPPTYITYICDIKKEYSAESFDLERIMYYSVHVASMASRFYRVDGPLILFTAANAICEVLHENGVFKGGWESLNLVSSKIISDFQQGKGLPDRVANVYTKWYNYYLI